MRQSVFLKITSGVAISGKIVRPGEIVELGEAEAKGLLRRGKVVVATESDMPKEAQQLQKISDGADAEENANKGKAKK